MARAYCSTLKLYAILVCVISNMVNELFSQAFTLLKKLDKKIIESLISKRDWIFLSSIPVTANNHRVSETYAAHADGPLLAFVSLLLRLLTCLSINIFLLYTYLFIHICFFLLYRMSAQRLIKRLLIHLRKSTNFAKKLSSRHELDLM